MTNEERDLISKFFARIGGGQSAGSTPQPMPPIDRDADALIAQQFQQYPDARYRLTQMALVQEGALAEAQNRIQRLQWEVDQAKQAMQQQQQSPQAAPQQHGFFSSLFGGGAAAATQAPRPGGPWGAQGGQQGYAQGYQPTSAPPPPQYPPNYQPGMFQRSGSGFLGSALTTAAGVAGGLVVGNALMGAFGHHGDGGAGGWGSTNASADGSDPFGGGGFMPASDPTTGGGFGDSGAGTAVNDPFAGGGMEKGGLDTNASYDQGGGGFDQGGGFDSGGGGSAFDGGGGFDNT